VKKNSGEGETSTCNFIDVMLLENACQNTSTKAENTPKAFGSRALPRPAEEAYSAPLDPLAGFKEAYF